MRRYALLAVVLLAGACADRGAQERAARTKVFTELSQPELAVVVGPAVMQSGYVMVDWTRGAFRGGRALLRKDGKDWVYVLCGGKPLTQPVVLQAAGMPPGAAEALTDKLRREEGRLPAARRTLLDQWAGLGAPRGVSCPEPKGG